MNVFITLAVIMLVVAWHEFGHYLAMRSLGVTVKQFAIGFGNPLIKTTDRRGTEWSIRPFLIGGFVMPEDDYGEKTPWWKKLIIALAGPFFNFIAIMGIALYFGFASIVLRVIPALYLGTFGLIGDTLARPFRAIAGWFTTATPEIITAPVAQAVGPVGMLAGEATPHATHLSVTLILSFLTINMGLMLFNLLPIPPLDGGKAVLAGVEGAFGYERSKRVGTVLSVIGALIVLAVILILTVSDIARIIGNLF